MIHLSAHLQDMLTDESEEEESGFILIDKLSFSGRQMTCLGQLIRFRQVIVPTKNSAVNFSDRLIT